MRARGGRGTVLVMVAVALVFAGCSGGSNDDRADARRFFAGADCASLRAVLDQSDLASTLSTGEDPTADLRAAATFFEDASKDAPDSIAADVKVLAVSYRDLADQVRTVDWVGIRNGNATAGIGAAQLGRRLANARFARAAFRLSGYAAGSCTH